MTALLALVVGLVIGAVAGVFAMALAVSTRRSEEDLRSYGGTDDEG